MDGVDKEKVQRIVYEMSKGSKYFENEERKEAFIRQKIEHMRVRCAKLSATDISHYQKVVTSNLYIVCFCLQIYSFISYLYSLLLSHRITETICQIFNLDFKKLLSEVYNVGYTPFT